MKYILVLISLFFAGCKINIPQTNSSYEEDLNKSVIMGYINRKRAEARNCGEYGSFSPASSLTWNNKLYNTALEHSNDMAHISKLSHEGSGTETDLTALAFDLNRGSSMIERMEYNGYLGNHSGPYGENVLYGTFNINTLEAIDLWLESPAHCANFMNPNFKEVGIAKSVNAKGWNYWSMELGR